MAVKQSAQVILKGDLAMMVFLTRGGDKARGTRFVLPRAIMSCPFGTTARCPVCKLIDPRPQSAVNKKYPQKHVFRVRGGEIVSETDRRIYTLSRFQTGNSLTAFEFIGRRLEAVFPGGRDIGHLGLSSQASQRCADPTHLHQVTRPHRGSLITIAGANVESRGVVVGRPC